MRLHGTKKYDTIILFSIPETGNKKNHYEAEIGGSQLFWNKNAGKMDCILTEAEGISSEK
jgi:hypothetical protein